jgi:hypothetical protein
VPQPADLPQQSGSGTGKDRTGQDRTGQDRTGQDRTGQDRTGQDRTGQDRTTACSSFVCAFTYFRYTLGRAPTCDEFCIRNEIALRYLILDGLLASRVRLPRVESLGSFDAGGHKSAKFCRAAFTYLFSRRKLTFQCSLINHHD